MNGMHKDTGKPLSGLAHLRQSIVDILSTAPETRIMRRDYGSDLFNLIDAPQNAATMARFYASVAVALDRWEPRLRLTKVTAEGSQSGEVILTVRGYYRHNGEEIQLEGISL
jgi:phage baseplate assembly protein W